VYSLSLKLKVKSEKVKTMNSDEIRSKFLDFFKNRGHVIVKSSSLAPTDPSVLLTTAGMQQFKQYYTQPELADRDFGSRNTVSIQKSFRTSDIDEVGDETHLTFFEMLGNFSFGGYFKKEAIEYAHEFIVRELGLKIDYVSIFSGDPSTSLAMARDKSLGASPEVPIDSESEQVWQSLGVKDIKKFGRADNFWGPTGAEGPCGPTTEIYVNGVEVWNIVFNEFYCRSDGTMELLKVKGVDTGMGLERLVVAVQKKNNIFETDLFDFINLIPESVSERQKRIMADHLRGTVFLLAEGIIPSNKDRGYILRRLMRRVFVYENINKLDNNLIGKIVSEIIKKYGEFYLEVNNSDILDVIKVEKDKYQRATEVGIDVLNNITYGSSEELGRKLFNVYQEFGFNLELALEILREKWVEMGEEWESDVKKSFERSFEKHQEISRAGAEKKFGGHGLVEGDLTAANEAEMKIKTRLHTVTHLLNAALHRVLGDEVSQRGSDITVERTRFDFVFGRKLTDEEIKKVEILVNDAIAQDYLVTIQEMPLDEAKKSGALFFYQGNYPDVVKVYSIGDFSKELCGGPHVNHTGEIGKFRIIKEESSSAGIRRIRAIVE